MKLLRCVFLLSFVFLQACGAKTDESLLEQVSGVWKAQNEDTIVTIHTADNRTSFYIDEKAIPVTVGSVDEENKTVNFNVKLADGTPQIWTVQQVWDQGGNSFHLRATLGNIQEDLSFVRRVSADDLNRLAAISNPKNQAGIATTAAADISVPEAPDAAIAPEEAAQMSAAPDEQQSESFAPSFDCARASNGAERLICSDSALAAADVELAQTYKAALGCVGDKADLKKEKAAWMSGTRNACSDSSCMLQEYEMRNGALQDYCAAM